MNSTEQHTEPTKSDITSSEGSEIEPNSPVHSTPLQTQEKLNVAIVDLINLARVLDTRVPLANEFCSHPFFVSLYNKCCAGFPLQWEFRIGVLTAVVYTLMMADRDVADQRSQAENTDSFKKVWSSSLDKNSFLIKAYREVLHYVAWVAFLIGLASFEFFTTDPREWFLLWGWAAYFLYGNACQFFADPDIYESILILLVVSIEGDKFCKADPETRRRNYKLALSFYYATSKTER